MPSNISLAACTLPSSRPPRIAFLVAGSARSFATSLVLRMFKEHLVDSLGSHGATKRLFLYLKAGDSPKFSGGTGETAYPLGELVHGAAAREPWAMPENVAAALELPWMRRLIAEAIIVNGSGTYNGRRLQSCRVRGQTSRQRPPG